MNQFEEESLDKGDDRARDLIHDWNVMEKSQTRTEPVEFDDETLRDGLQSPSVVDPPIEQKFEILRLMDRLGIHTANVGLPGAGPRAIEDVTRLCQLIVDENLSITPNCAARTHEKDIDAVARISQKVGIPIECCTFIGSSPIRQYTEDWTLGNTSMDLLLANLKLLGFIDNDLTLLPEYVQKVSDSCHVPIPRNYPIFGTDAFETATGVHAAAVIKAFRKGDRWLANRVYSGVPADEFGLSQKISVGPMSGKSNVIFWLEQRGIEPTEVIVGKIFDHAKKSDRILSDKELLSLVSECDPHADQG